MVSLLTYERGHYRPLLLLCLFLSIGIILFKYALFLDGDLRKRPFYDIWVRKRHDIFGFHVVCAIVCVHKKNSFAFVRLLPDRLTHFSKGVFYV